MADSVAYLCPKVKENGKQCAAFLKWKQKFCKECGYLIPQKFWNEQQNDIRCGGIDENGEPCGQKLDLHDKFCSNCGKEVSLSMAPSQNSLPNEDIRSFITVIPEVKSDCLEKRDMSQPETTVNIPTLPTSPGNRETFPAENETHSTVNTVAIIQTCLLASGNLVGPEEIIPLGHDNVYTSVVESQNNMIQHLQAASEIHNSIDSIVSECSKLMPGIEEHNLIQTACNSNQENSVATNDESIKGPNCDNSYHVPFKRLKVEETPLIQGNEIISWQQSQSSRDIIKRPIQCDLSSQSSLQCVCEEKITDHLSQNEIVNFQESSSNKDINKILMASELSSLSSSQNEYAKKMTNQSPQSTKGNKNSTFAEIDSQAVNKVEKSEGSKLENRGKTSVEDSGNKEKVIDNKQKSVGDSVNKEKVIDKNKEKVIDNKQKSFGDSENKEKVIDKNKETVIDNKQKAFGDSGNKEKLIDNSQTTVGDSGNKEKVIDKKQVEEVNGSKEKCADKSKSVKNVQVESKLSGKDIGISGQIKENAYRKSDKPADNYFVGDKSKDTSNVKPKIRPTYTVNFHVFISTKWAFDPSQNHKAYLRVDLERLGRWKSSEHILEPVEKILEPKTKHGFYRMKISIKFYKEELLNKIAYKYYIVSKQSEDDKSWEHLPSPDKLSNRHLFIPREIVNSLDKYGEWHQYDGVAFPEKGIDWRNVLSLGLYNDKSILHETIQAFRFFLPKWNGLYHKADCTNDMGLKAYTKILQVVNSFTTSLRLYNMASDDRIAKELLMEFYIEPTIESFSNEKYTKHYNAKMGGLRIASALAVIGLTMEYKLDCIREEKFLNALCDALLLRVDQATNSCEEYQEFLAEHIAGFEDEARQIFSNFVELLGNSRFIKNWLYLIPFMHLLCGFLKPILPAKKHQSPEWWGINKDVQKLIDQTKLMNSSIDLLLDDYISKLAPLFQIDELLPRTMIASLNINSVAKAATTKYFPPDVLAANLYYFIKSDIYIATKQSDVISIATSIKDIVLLIQHQDFEKLRFSVSSELIAATMNIVIDLVKLCMDRVTQFDLKHKDMFIQIISCVINCINVTKNFSSKQKELTDLAKKEYFAIFTTTLDAVLKWLSFCLPFYLKLYYDSDFADVGKEIKVYSELLNMTISDERFQENWLSAIIAHLHQRISSITLPEKKIELFCRLTFEQCHPLVEDCFSEVALKEIEHVSQNPFADLKFLFGVHCDASKVQNLIRLLVEKVWPKSADGKPSTDHMDIMKRLLEYKSFALCINAFCNAAQPSGRNRDYVDRYVDLIIETFSVFDLYVKKLFDGSIPIQYLKIILKNFSSFVEACKIFRIRLNTPEMKNTDTNLAALMESVYTNCQTKLEFLQKNVGWAQDLKTLCENLRNVDISDLRNFISMDFSNVSLNDCVATMEGPETAHLKIICTLSETTVLNLPSISKLSQSLLFKQMYWKPQCRTKLNQLQQAEEHNELLKIDTLIKKIFLPAKEEWQKLCQQIKDGTVTFQILDKLLEICGKNMEQIESEINLMAEKSGEKWQKKTHYSNCRIYQTQEL